ncbi:MAG: hypothetical protein KKD77_24555 [Gammaproteobacteria bacterium]|nr:hypothetical protein [Gammaproteobacteria bacterium]
MKKTKYLLIIIVALLFASQSFAAWTLTPSRVGSTKHHLYWKLVMTSDGASLAATDILQYMDAGLLPMVRSSTMMIMNISPGEGSVIPNTTINITLTDAGGIAVFSETGYSKDADTVGISLATDYNQYLPVYDTLSITMNDIGDSGDQVTLFFDCWLED